MAAAASSARLDAFARGAIWGMHCCGASPEEIIDTVTKKDGSAPCRRAVNKVTERKTLEPAWRGEDSQAGGRRQELTRREQLQLSRLVFRARAQRPW